MFARAAGEGSTLAMFNLGVAFLKGRGLQKSVDQARAGLACGTQMRCTLAKTHWDAFRILAGRTRTTPT